MHAPRIVHVEVVFTMKSGAWFQRNLDATMNYRRWPRSCRTHLSPPRRPGFPAARGHYFGRHMRGFGNVLKAVLATNWVHRGSSPTRQGGRAYSPETPSLTVGLLP